MGERILFHNYELKTESWVLHKNGSTVLGAMKNRILTRCWNLQGDLWRQWPCDGSPFGGLEEPRGALEELKLARHFLGMCEMPEFPAQLNEV